MHLVISKSKSLCGIAFHCFTILYVKWKFKTDWKLGERKNITYLHKYLVIYNRKIASRKTKLLYRYMNQNDLLLFKLLADTDVKFFY